MDQDTITFLRDVCKKIKEVADLLDRFLALQAAKKKREESSLMKRNRCRIDLYLFLSGMNTMIGHRSTP